MKKNVGLINISRSCRPLIIAENKNRKKKIVCDRADNILEQDVFVKHECP